MTESDSQGWHGIFDGQKVPFDLRAIFLAAVACGLFKIGLLCFGYFATIQGVPELVSGKEMEVWVSMGSSEMFQRFFNGFGRMFVGLQYFGHHPEVKLLSWPWYFTVLSFLFVIWVFFGAMINRIIVVKIAKDDVINIPTAFRFANQNKLAYFLTPLVLFGLVGVLCFCNCLAGFVSQIPWIGPFLYMGLYFLVVLSTIFIFLISIGAIFGFNLISSAISVEGSDGLEAVISVYNYIYSRPWHFVFYYFLTFLFMGILCFVSHFFVDFSLTSSGIRTDTLKIEKVGQDGGKIVKTILHPFSFKSERDPKTGHLKSVRETSQEIYYLPPLPGKELPADAVVYQQGLEVIGEYVYGVPFERPSVNENEGTDNFGKPTTTTTSFPLSEIREFPLKVAAIVILVFTTLIQYFFYGWILAYFISASTLIYFLLRKDVDGTEYEEIYEEDEEEDPILPLVPPEKKKAVPPSSAPAEPVASNVVVHIPEHLRRKEKKEEKSAEPDVEAKQESPKTEIKEETAPEISPIKPTASEQKDDSPKQEESKAEEKLSEKAEEKPSEKEDEKLSEKAEEKPSEKAEEKSNNSSESSSTEESSSNEEEDPPKKEDDDNNEYRGPKIFV